MAGDGEDVKLAVASLLRSPKFLATLATVVAEKGDGVSPRLPLTVFAEERLTNQVYPSAELILYRTRYDGEIVKQGTHTIGVRWTAVADTEGHVTAHIERLVTTTTEVVWNSLLDMRVSSGPMRVVEEDYSPLGSTADYPYLKSALILLEVDTWRS